VAVTQIDLDADAVTEAMHLSGATTKKETVNLAQREYVARHRRVEALARHAANARRWDFAGWQEQRAADKHHRK